MRTLEEFNAEIDAHITAAENCEATYEKLIKRYGEGVRPGWVSTDLAIEREYANHYRKKAHELMMERDAIKW